MHSARQTMRNENVGFGYKSFVFASSDGYPYHIIPYSGAKGVGSTRKKINCSICFGFGIASQRRDGESHFQ